MSLGCILHEEAVREILIKHILFPTSFDVLQKLWKRMGQRKITNRKYGLHIHGIVPKSADIGEKAAQSSCIPLNIKLMTLGLWA